MQRTFFTILKAARSLLHFLDMLTFFISPVAMIGFLIIIIIGLDRFGEHVQLVRALDHTFVETSGTWSPPDSVHDMGYVAFDHEEQGWDGVVIKTKFYSPETLAALKEGQVVRVRYTYPPVHEREAVLADAYAQVKNYTGHISELLWPFLLFWGIMVIHPEFLYLGFDDPFKTEKRG